MSDPTAPVQNPQDPQDQQAAAFWSQPSPEQQKAQALRQSVSYGATQNPDEYAKALRLAAKTGIAPALAKDYRPEAEQAATVNSIDFDSFVRDAPSVAGWASSPDNAAVAHDDLHNLWQIEAAKRNGIDIGEARALTPLEAFNMKYLNPVVQKLQGFPITRAAIGAVGGTAGFVGDIGSFFGIHGNNRTGKNLLQRVQFNLDPAQTGSDFLPAQHTGFDAVVQNAAPMIPITLLSGGTGTAARMLGLSDKAAKILQAATVGTAFTAQQGGQTYNQVLESGGSADQARHDANVVAGINAPVNFAFGLSHLIPAFERNPFASSLVLGGAQGASGQVAQNVVTGRPLMEGVPEATLKGAAVQGGFHMGGTLVGEMAQASALAEQSRLKARDAGKFREAMSEVYADRDSLQIPVEDFDSYFHQSGIDPETMAQNLGVKNYAEAKAAGTPVEIRPEDFLARLDAEHQKALLPDIVEPELSMTPRQAQSAVDEVQQFIQEGGLEKLQAKTQEIDAENAASPEYAAVKDELNRRFQATGERPEIADNYATLMANVYSNLARETGMKPTELLKLYDPKIVLGQPGDGGMVTEQNAAPYQYRAGGPNPMTVDAVHYGPSGLSELDPSFFGKGAAGREMRRLSGLAPEDPLRQRVMFYAAKDGALPPKEWMVKGDPYAAKLTNVYDLQADPDGIRAKADGDANAMERMITEAGYDGYWAPAPGEHGSVVMLGTGKIPVRPFGDGVFNQSVTIRQGRESLKSYGLDPSRSYTVREVAAALEARQLKKYGGIDPSDRSPEAAKKIAKWMTDEVMFEMQHPENSGVGWYSDKFQRALDAFSGEFPELKTDQGARDLMTALIAVTSDGQKVLPNFRQAVDLYGNFRKTGKFETDRGHIRMDSIEGNLAKIQDLIDTRGTQGLRDYLLKEATVSELSKLAKAEGIKFSTDYQAHIKLPMSAIVFGPKLGAFYANLMGAEGYLTMDRWWSRTFNRYRGDLLPEPTKQGLERLKSLMGDPSMTDEQAISSTVPLRKSYEAKGFKNGTELEKAANTIWKAAFGELNDAPNNASDRTFMLDSVNQAKKMLEKKGIHMSVADIQATLWYYEKRLYGELGARQSADISYEEAAQQVASERTGNPAGGRDLPGDAAARGEAGTEGVPGASGANADGEPLYQSGRVEFPAPSGRAQTRPAKVDSELARVADEYRKSRGIDKAHDGLYVAVDAEYGARVANAYEAMAHAPNDPQVKAAYDALIEETKAQYDHLVKAGYTFEPWTGKGEPYKSSADMLKDVRENKHMWFFTTDNGFGSSVDEKYPGNPLLQTTGIKIGDHEMLANDLFRVVHDVMGHAVHGFQFGPRGEENAYRHHASMYSDLAARALATETRGQNSWVNFGPHGESNRANPHETVFADQKTGLLPEEMTRVYGGNDTLYQSAYHGSPYHFDKFSLEHLGSGEGAHAFGWGLYFAGRRGVAEHYRQTLSANRFTYDGKLIDPEKDWDLHSAAELLFHNKGDKALSLDDAKWYVTPSGKDIGEGVRRNIEKLDYSKIKQAGQLYKVDIPDDGKYLLWDKPLSEQPEAVRKAADGLIAKLNAFVVKGHNDVVELNQRVRDGDLTGEELYKGAEKLVGSDMLVSKALSSLGVPGIKYLDGNSRGAGEGHHNYVLFDDSAVKILNTYYQGDQGGPRGWFRMLPDGTFEIGKTKIGDLSTFIHEPAHSYLFMISDLVKREGASDVLKSDSEKIAKFLGAENLDNLSREQHEKWARANEAYLREGKAPSEGLRGVFQRFAVWLGSIYRKASALNVEMSDEIRGVFDRLYAAEEGVSKAHDDIAGPQLFKSAEEAGWSEAEFKKYAEAKGMELDQAKADILSKLNEAAMRERTSAWREEERNVREAITAQVDQRPEYRAIRVLRKGEMEDGTPVALSREALEAQFGAEAVKQLQSQHPNLYRKEGGLDPDAAAELLGFDSGKDLMDTLMSTPKRSEAIDQGTRDFMIQKHGDIRYDGSLQDEANLAVSNEQRAENLHKELQALARKNNPEAELAAAKRELAKAEREAKREESDKAKLERRDAKIAELKQKIADLESTGKWADKAAAQGARRAMAVPPIEAFRAAAANAIEGKSIMDLDPSKYLDAQRRYSREAYSNALKGNYSDAAEAKQRELMNHFLYREAVKAKREADNIFQYVKKFSRSTIREKLAKAGGEMGQHVYLDQVDQLLERYQFKQATNKAIRERQSLQAFVLQKESEGEPIAIDPSVYSINAKNYRELSVGELTAVRDALRNIEALARNDLGFIRDGRRINFETEIARFDEAARANLTSRPVPRSGSKLTTTEKAGRWARGWDSYMTKIEWLVDALDKGDINGPARANIKRPIDEANSRRNEMASDIFGKLKKLVEARPKEDVDQLFDSTGIQFPSMDRPMNRSQLISWALNLGTEENRKVAILGEGLMNGDGSLKPEFYQALGALRKSEAEFVQGVWDILDGMLPEIKAKALRTTGIEPKLKRVIPFTIKTADGAEVEMRGGYYPLKGDPAVADVGRRQQDPSQREAFGYSSPKTSTSHLKEVTGATYRLMLDYEHVLGQHLNDVINDTAAGEAISQVYKFISNKQVYQTLQETLGPQEASEFLPWLQDFANNRKSDPNEGGPILRFLMARRTGMVAARLGANLTSYMIQGADVFKAFADPDIKSSYIAKAFLDIRRNPSEVIEEIRQLSPNEMRHREENFNREIREMLTSKSMFEKHKARVTEFVMQGFQVMDRLVTFPVWLARYRQGLAEHGNPVQAVREADRVIARSFQAGESRNMSRMMREKGMAKLLTTFQGDSNTWYGLISSAVRGQDPTRISIALMALVAEQVVSQMIRNRPPKKDENKGEWLAYQALLAGIGKIPVLGDVAQYATDKATGRYASLPNPTFDALEKSLSAPASIIKSAEGKQDAEKALQDTVEAAGLWMGIPGTAQIVRSWRYIHKVNSGEERPSGTLDAAVGAVTGGSGRKK